MADILVRIPANQIVHFFDEKMRSEMAFWRFGKRPRKLAAGDCIFFSTPDGVVAGAKLTKIADERELDETLSAEDLTRLDPSGAVNAVWPGRDTKHFSAVTDINYAQQSFRYLTPDEQKRLRRKMRHGYDSNLTCRRFLLASFYEHFLHRSER